MKATIQMTIIAVLVFGVSAYGHHSIVGTYDYNKHVTLDAKIVQVSLRNPHSFIQVEAPDPNGVVQRWSLEWGSAAQLVNQGVDRNSFKIGDKVVVTGNPARSGDTRARLENIRRPSDGLSWGMKPGQVVE
jgi:Family of unknown function (DUF6152)